MNQMPEDNNDFLPNHTEAEARLIRAAEFFKDGKMPAAEETLKKITEDFTDFFPGLAAYGDLLLNIGEPAKALAPLRKAVKLSIHEGIGHYLLGVAYLKTSRFYHALRSLEAAKALLQEKGDLDAHIGRARLMLGDAAASRELISQALKDDNTNAFIYMDMAQTYVQTKEFNQALKWLESAKALAPEEPFVQENLSNVKTLKRKFDKLPLQKQKELQEISQSKSYQEEMRIQLLMASLQEGPGSTEDLAEVTEEMRQAGLTGQIAMFKNPDAPKARQAQAYIATHKKLEKIGKWDLSDEECQKLEKTLTDPKSSKKEKLEALIRLAKHGQEKTLKILADYKNQPDPEFEVWASMAYEECRSFVESKQGDLPPIKLHVLD